MIARLGTAIVTLLLASAFVGPVRAHEPTPSRFNYRDHVRPLFLKHCAGCHRTEGVAPMSLLEYQEAVPWANAIKRELLERRMPPFLPDEEGEPFRNARSLTARELDILVDWSVGATPEGEPLEPLDETPSNAPRWPAGEPELALEPRIPVVLAADEYEKTACVVLPSPLERSRIASGFELASDAPAVLRRATILLGDSCSGGEPLATWLPDQGRIAFPEGFGREVPPSSPLALELQYVKGWDDEAKRIEDRMALGLWFSDTAVPLRSVRIESTGKLETAATLLSIYPEPPPEGSDEPLRVEVTSPDGSTRLLLLIDAFDPAWREKYVFEQPVSVPRGARVHSSQSAVWIEFVPSSRASGQ